MASSTSAAASVPVPEQIVIPQVPDRVTLAQTLQSGDEGILATFTDLYADIFNTATSLCGEAEDEALAKKRTLHKA